MSFTVNLYNFSKRENSTKQPAGSPASFSCLLKEASGIVAPEIMLDLGRTASPAGYNYAYISEFKRYYWIREWRYESPLWTASMVCDVLATYKTQIGASSLYVLRAASAYDGNIVDNLYPMKAIPTHSVTSFNTPWHGMVDTSGSIAGGSFIVGIVTDRPTHGSITYYAIPMTSMVILTVYLTSSLVSATNGFDLTDATYALQKSIIDPFEYIKSCIWIPAAITTANYEDIYVMDFNTGAKGYRFNRGDPGVNHGSITISSLPRHPQAAARGAYMNIAPYTEAALFIPPFGLIHLDTRILASSPSITCDYRIDCFNGSGILNVEIAGTVTNRINAQLGVPVQLSQIRQNIIGGITHAAGAAVQAMAGNALGAAAGIGSAVQAAMPQASTIGSSGGWSDLSGTPGVVQHFYPVTDDDPDHAGRPLMQVKQISSLSGFVMVQDGDVPIDGTASEAAEIRSYLEGGFFYE